MKHWFTNLISKLVTPHAAFDMSWHLPNAQKEALESSLKDFLTSLVSLTDFNEDKFLQRTLTEMVRIYAGRFDPAPQNPLLPLISTPPSGSPGKAKRGS